MNTMRITFLGLVCSVLMVPAAFAGTLDTVKSQGFFNCGVSQEFLVFQTQTKMETGVVLM